MSDGQLMTLSRAARLIGVIRGELQKKIQQGDLHAFAGMVSIDDLLLAYPNAQLEDDVEYRRVSQIKEKAFGKRVYERAMPDVETLATRVTELSKELAISQSQVRQFRQLLDHLNDKLKQIGEQAEDDAQGALKGLIDWLGDEAMATQEPDYANPLAVRDNLLLGSSDPGDDAIMAMAERTGLASLIQAHPRGLDLPISEGGRGLSGGQRVLTGLTRLLLARPKLLLRMGGWGARMASKVLKGERGAKLSGKLMGTVVSFNEALNFKGNWKRLVWPSFLTAVIWANEIVRLYLCLLYTSPSPRDS